MSNEKQKMIKKAHDIIQDIKEKKHGILSGESFSLEGIEAEISVLCLRIQTYSDEDTKEFEPLLQEMIQHLDDLTIAIQSHQKELESELDSQK